MTVVCDTLAPFLAATTLMHSFDVDRDGVVREANRAAALRLQMAAGEIVGVELATLVIEDDREAVYALAAGSRTTALLHFVGADRVSFPLDVHALQHETGTLLLGEPPLLPYLRLSDSLFEHANELSVQARERGRKAKRLTERLAEHEQSYWHLQRDQEVLPVCLRCNRVRTADGAWEDLLAFLHRSSAFLSHTYCDTCEREVL